LRKRLISGVLLLDKPPGLSSNAALQKVKFLFQCEKAGHTGTLDPLATGLLPVCLGEASKFSQSTLDSSKSYQAVVKLGETTSTGDCEGEILSRKGVAVSRVQVKKAIKGLLGHIEQVPPMYSAIKHRGKPLYVYARQGKQVQRAPRKVYIDSLQLDDMTGQEIQMTIHCSKGTYIRVLAQDLGERLGCGAHLTGLRRTRVGAFRLNEAHTLQQLEAMNLEQRDACLLPIDSLLLTFPRILVDDADCRNLMHGKTIAQRDPLSCGTVRIYNMKQRLIGLGEILPEGKIKPRRLIATNLLQ